MTPAKKLRTLGIGGVLLLALLLWVWPAPARADGLVISARPVADAGGPQMDAGLVSPAPRVQAPADVERFYTVQSGDTLTALAAHFATEPAALAARNGMALTDRLAVGRMLELGPAPGPAPVLPPGGPLERLQAWPWPPVQGQTLVVWLRLRAAFAPGVALTPTVSLAGRPAAVSGGAAGEGFWALLPIAPLAEPGSYGLQVSAGGVTFTLAVPVQPGVFEVQEIPAAASDPILSEAAKVNAEYARMTALFAGHRAGGWTPGTRFRSPLAEAYPHTSPFGSRRTYGASTDLTAHLGEDFGAPPGTAVLAPAPGVVVLAEPLFVRGNAVVLDHGGVFTGYWHLQSADVTVGQRVAQGQKLGEVGSTGLSSGPHLHWELRIGGAAVDPLQWWVAAGE